MATAFLPDVADGPLVVCAGMAVIDNVYGVDRFPAPGTKTRARSFFSVLGGCAANAAVSIRRLGARARVVVPLGGQAGFDLTGDTILALFERESIDASRVARVDEARSSQSSIFIDGSGERLIMSYRDPLLKEARPVDPQNAVSGANAVLVDNRFPEFVLPVACAAMDHRMTVVLDGDRPMHPDDALLSTVTHIIFSADGLRGTIGVSDLGAALHAVAKKTRAFVAVTDGANDILWLQGGSLVRLYAFRIEVVDTLGAGDVFHGAFTLALAEGRDITAAMRFAAATAAVKCGRTGGGAGAPSRAEVDEFLTRN